MFEEHDRVVAAGTPLVEVGDPSSIEVVIPVLTRDALSVTPRLPVRLRLGEGRTVRGEVVRVEPAAYTKLSPLGVEEQRVNVRARFLEAVSGVGDGYEVHASIVTWQTDSALSVPVTGLVPHDTGWAVYVVSRGRARLNPVAVGRRGGMAAEVLTGVAAGDTVVSYPDERLSVGTRLRPAEPRR
ncbi:MAG: HlyD family efflux transporter periplasmic adaptor subunit [Gemmatimonadaceae bacterium]